MAGTRRIVVVGGVAAGTKAAARARRCDPGAEITLVEKGDVISYAGCALPYYLSGVVADRADLVVSEPEEFAALRDIDVRTATEAVAIDRQVRTVTVRRLADGREQALRYDDLVLTTGSVPVVPPIEGWELAGVFRLKEPADAMAIEAELATGRVERAVIVGGGLIGMEMAEALTVRGVRVAVVEMMDRVLAAFLGPEMAAILHAHLREHGVELRLGARALRFEGDAAGHVRQVVTSAGELGADLVLLAIGVRPNVALAREAGLTLGETGAIAVDDHLRTSDPHIYAGGDCVENVHRLTGRPIYSPLGSTANKHGRVIGTNVAGGDECFAGVLGTMIVKVFEFAAGATGLSEARAREAGYSVITGLAPALDRAHNYPARQDIVLKAVADAHSGRLLGLQGVGAGEVAKRIDVAATAISLGATIDQVADIDLAYAPPFAPAVDPVHHAANVIRNKRDGLAQAVGPLDLQEMLDGGHALTLLDVRTRAEFASRHIAAGTRLLHIPQDELRARLAEVPRDLPVIVCCARGVRAYRAARLLRGMGLSDVSYLEGSMLAWAGATEAGPAADS